MRGFIALTSVLIISAILLLIVVANSVPAFYARLDQIANERKSESRLLAESCAGVVELKIMYDPAYMGSESFAVADATCAVRAVVRSKDAASFTITLNYQDAFTTLAVPAVLTDTPSLTEQEIPN